jgi:hypothetical protein
MQLYCTVLYCTFTSDACATAACADAEADVSAIKTAITTIMIEAGGNIAVALCTGAAVVHITTLLEDAADTSIMYSYYCYSLFH